jgi:hypothetical protein
MDERLGYMPGNGHALRFPKDPSGWFNGQTRGFDVNFEWTDSFTHQSIGRLLSLSTTYIPFISRLISPE